MMGSIPPDELADVLSRYHVGPLAHIADERPYVVAITCTHHVGASHGQARTLRSGLHLRAVRAARCRPAPHRT